jgi:DNA-binding beta-propeller fold protein YncE
VAASNDGPHAGSVYVTFTPDRHLLFVANERSTSLSVYDTSRLPAGLEEVGRIAVGQAPVGLAISQDGRYLYIYERSWPIKLAAEMHYRRAAASGRSPDCHRCR